MSNLVNTFGTYNNFKKQSQGLTVGRYGGLNQVQPQWSKTDQVIEALSGAANAHIATSEAMRRSEGLSKAEHLLQSTNEKDRVELDSRALLQQAGMIDLADNVYAMALIEKDAGKLIGDKFAYDYKESMIKNNTYKKSREEQMDDFKQQRQQYFAELRTKRAFADEKAFTEGFHERYGDDQHNVHDIWTQWFSAKSLEEAKLNLQRDVSSFDLVGAIDAGTASQDFGRILYTAIQAGVEADTLKEALLKKYADYLENTPGELDPKVTQFLKDCTVGFYMTGEKAAQPKSLKDVLGYTQPLDDAMAKANKINYTLEARKIRDNFQKAAETGSREEVRKVFDGLPFLTQKNYRAEVAQWENRADAENRRKLAAQAQAIAQQKKLQLRAAGYQNALTSGMAQVNAYLKGFDRDSYGRPVGSFQYTDYDTEGLPVSKSISKEQKDMVFNAYLNEIRGMDAPEGVRLSQMLKVMGMDAFKDQANAYSGRLVLALSRLDEGSLEQDATGDRLPSAIQESIDLMHTDPTAFKMIAGDSGVYNQLQAIDSLLRSTGTLKGAVGLFKQAQDTLFDPAKTAFIRDQAKETMRKGATVKVQTMDGEDVAIDLNNDANLNEDIKEHMTYLIAAGVQPKAAFQTARDAAIRSNVSYRGQLIPKRLFDQAAHPDYGEKVLDSLVETFSDKTGCEAAYITLRYDYTTRKLKIWGAGSYPDEYTATELAQKADELYIKEHANDPDVEADYLARKDSQEYIEQVYSTIEAATSPQDGSLVDRFNTGMTD